MTFFACPNCRQVAGTLRDKWLSGNGVVACRYCDAHLRTFKWGTGFFWGVASVGLFVVVPISFFIEWRYAIVAIVGACVVSGAGGFLLKGAHRVDMPRSDETADTNGSNTR